MKPSNLYHKILFALFSVFTISACSPAVVPETPRDIPTQDGNNLSPPATNTAIVYPSATLAPTPLTCWKEGGRISEKNIPSELLSKPFDFIVYLPPCYQQQVERRYPVLYLIHGKNFTQDQWDRIGVDEMADTLIAAGEVAPFIIVMPYDRMNIPPSEDPFGEALITELIPWIDQNYRTLPHREYRAIGGLSRGAAWAIHLGLGNWDLFGAVGAHSMALFWEDVSAIPPWLEGMHPGEIPRIFVDAGRQDFEEIRNSSAWFGDLLTEMDIPHEWYSFAGTHDEDYWRSHLEQYIRFYALEW